MDTILKEEPRHRKMLQGGYSDSNRIYKTDQIGGIRKRLRIISVSQFLGTTGNQVTDSRQIYVQKLGKRGHMITTHMADADDANSQRIQHRLLTSQKTCTYTRP